MSNNGNRFLSLDCTQCKAAYPARTHSLCSRCGGVLTGSYNLEGLELDLRRVRRNSIWDFGDLLPPVSSENIVSLGEGWTKTVATSRGGRISCKLEGENPSGSFKDRAASLGLSLVKEWRMKGVFTASSGNAAAAIAAYSARAGLSCLVLVREDSTPSKLGQISMYGPAILRVRGLFDTRRSLEEGLELTQKALPEWLNHFVWAPYNPLLVDGLKTIAYEIAADYNKEMPDYIFVPTAGGDLLYAIYKGFAELKSIGAVESIPKMVAVQGSDADPTVQAIEKGLSTVPETEKSETVAGALRVNFGAPHSLLAVRGSKGFGVAVSDEEIISAQREVAKTEGIFCELSSAAALAGINKSLREQRIERDESVLAVLTGSGFKDYQPIFKEISQVPLAESPESIPIALNAIFSRSQC